MVAFIIMAMQVDGWEFVFEQPWNGRGFAACFI